jgi:lipopolysaccharide/colanic/teichoic acid biosynthesis glycosyltransferase
MRSTHKDERLWPFVVRPDVPGYISEACFNASDLLRLWISRAVALVILCLASPLMLALAWLIRRDGGPATFTQYRVGARGRLFRCIKFRTMRIDAERALHELLEGNAELLLEWQRSQKLREDPRVTRVGKWLRRTSLDELPQLLNVLRGEMALVGRGPSPSRSFAATVPRAGITFP